MFSCDLNLATSTASSADDLFGINDESKKINTDNDTEGFFGKKITETYQYLIVHTVTALLITVMQNGLSSNSILAYG